MYISTLATLTTLAASALAAPLVIEKRCTTYTSDASGTVCIDRPDNCDATYLVQPGDTCTSIAEAQGTLTVSQLYQWNPEALQTCTGLQAYVPVCIHTTDYVFTPPVQPAYDSCALASQIPVPIMPNTVATCSKFVLVAPGEPQATVLQNAGITQEQFAEWNGGAATAWAATWACVSVDSGASC